MLLRLILAALLLSWPALAQQQLDPRTAPHDMLMLQAQVGALQAHLLAQKQDGAAREREIAPALRALRWATLGLGQ